MNATARDLAGLYPFLDGTSRDPERIRAVLQHSAEEKARESRETNARFFEAQASALVAAARAVADVYRRGGRLFAMGNGGSSCDASHVAVEFMHPVTAGRPALAATNLVADTANLTALGNDVGFENVFARQVEVLGRPGDGLVGISTSGNSPDLLNAFARAREKGLVTIGLSGGDGGRMAAAGFLDHCLVVPSDSIHRVQECHVVVYHVLWDLVHTMLADDRGSAAKVGEAA
jgi:D-sedoheptulose 7-phosphate isomerase